MPCVGVQEVHENEAPGADGASDDDSARMKAMKSPATALASSARRRWRSRSQPERAAKRRPVRAGERSSESSAASEKRVHSAYLSTIAMRNDGGWGWMHAHGKDLLICLAILAHELDGFLGKAGTKDANGDADNVRAALDK
eukprot:2390060-Pleurochrysis_carterae.AAC.3